MASIKKRITTRTVIDEETGLENVVTIERYRARYRDEAGKEHARHFDRKVDAQRFLDNVTASVVRGDYVDPARSRMTVGEAASAIVKRAASPSLWPNISSR